MEYVNCDGETEKKACFFRQLDCEKRKRLPDPSG